MELCSYIFVIILFKILLIKHLCTCDKFNKHRHSKQYDLKNKSVKTNKQKTSVRRTSCPYITSFRDVKKCRHTQSWNAVSGLVISFLILQKIRIWLFPKRESLIDSISDVFKLWESCIASTFHPNCDSIWAHYFLALW